MGTFIDNNNIVKRIFIRFFIRDENVLFMMRILINFFVLFIIYIYLYGLLIQSGKKYFQIAIPTENILFERKNIHWYVSNN